MIEEIYKKLLKFFRLRAFVFRIDIYNGTEESNSIYSDQVFQYEFINQGTTICVINGGLYLYPQFSGMCSCHKVMNVNSNEKDVTIYEYKFLPLDYQVASSVVAIDPPGGNFTVNRLIESHPGDIQFNKLTVISKTFARVRS